MAGGPLGFIFILNLYISVHKSVHLFSIRYQQCIVVLLIKIYENKNEDFH